MPRGAQGVARVPDDLLLGPEETLAQAQRLIGAGRPFNAHEVLEARWKTAPEGERNLWQGLAQFAVGLTHIQRGNTTGAAVLLMRGADRIAGYAKDPPYGVQVDELVAYARRRADELVADRGEQPEPPPRLAH